MTRTEQKNYIFGFGSLVNSESLRATAPNAQDIRPAYIAGFSRQFNMWDAVGFSETNPDVAGIPHCALDVSKIVDEDSQINGVLFEVSVDDLKALQRREAEYEMLETPVFDFDSSELLGNCYVFSAGKNDGTYDFDSLAQTRYLEVCLDGARNFGERFYNEFLRTTLIDGQPLSRVFDLPYQTDLGLQPQIQVA